VRVRADDAAVDGVAATALRPGGRVAGEACRRRGRTAPDLVQAIDARRKRAELVRLRIRVDDRPERIERQLLHAVADEPLQLGVGDERLNLRRPELLVRMEDEHRLVGLQQLHVRGVRSGGRSRERRDCNERRDRKDEYAGRSVNGEV
jgi:hypothetical protein